MKILTKKRALFIAAFLLYVICIATCSCTNEKKATGYLNDHKDKAAKYCSEVFPVKPETITQFIEVDSSGYNEAYNNLLTYADSILSILDSSQKENLIINPTTYQVLPESKKVNIDSLRKSIILQLKKSLHPCVDSVVHIREVVPDMAKIYYLNSEIDKRDKTITEQGSKITTRSKQRNYLFLFLLLLLLWTFRKPLLTLLKFA